ncbi:MAG: glycosyltransferase family 4 protein [Treponema sp.]|nr:glycosyltransferase family 4 protein [Treponema sp.]
MQKKLLINGNFLCRNLTGIERFAFEICRQFDILLEDETTGLAISILVPANAKIVPDYKNISLIYGTELKSFPRWDLFYFSKMCKKLDAAGLNFSNTAPLGKNCGYAFLHDIYAADFPGDFNSFKDKLIRFYSCFHYKNIARNAKKIFTVSEFSKKQIQKAYNVPENRICVIPNGWDHFKNIEEDDKIFEKFPVLTQKPFFFTLGSLQKRKNLKWISEYAKNHPDQTFAISGKTIGGMKSEEIGDLSLLNNVVLLGYVSDSEVKSLMKKCLAFVFPSYYEGFGIPPLEALSVGAKIIVAKSASLPEIYKKSAHYIDSGSTNCDLNAILNEEVCSSEEILNEFTYKNSAKKLYEALK